MNVSDTANNSILDMGVKITYCTINDTKKVCTYTVINFWKEWKNAAICINGVIATVDTTRNYRDTGIIHLPSFAVARQAPSAVIKAKLAQNHESKFRK